MEIREPISQYVYQYQGVSDYDAACVRLLSLKVILAYILKSCVDEFNECKIEDILLCIDGEPEVRNLALLPDQPDLVKNVNTVDKTF